MSQLVQLRQKIRSIQTTKKITHAVRLISMAFYNKLDKINTPLNIYTQNIKDLFLGLVGLTPTYNSTLLSTQDITDSTPLYIIVATSKGLCGSLNSNLLRYLESSLIIGKHQTPKFIAIGQKAIAYVKEKDMGDLISSYADLNSNNFLALADDLVDKIINNPTPYSSVTLYGSQAKSFFSQRPLKSNLLPITPNSLQTKEKDTAQTEQTAQKQLFPLNNEDALIWEQDQQEILETLAVRYLRSAIIHVLFQALRAEHAARFLAMENSTNNAEKYLDRLTLQFNKLRQALITKELSELSASFLPHH